MEHHEQSPLQPAHRDCKAQRAADEHTRRDVGWVVSAAEKEEEHCVPSSNAQRTQAPAAAVQATRTALLTIQAATDLGAGVGVGLDFTKTSKGTPLVGERMSTQDAAELQASAEARACRRAVQAGKDRDWETVRAIVRRGL